MNKRKKRKIIIAIVLLSIIFLQSGLTYAYYRTKILGNPTNETIKLATDKLELVYGDNSSEILTGNDLLEPTRGTASQDAIGTKNFTVTNNGSDTSYVVKIEDVKITNVMDGTETTFESNDFKYKLSCTIISENSERNGTNCSNVDQLTQFPINGGILLETFINEKDVHSYTFTMWYIDNGLDQSNDMGKTLQAKINIDNVSSNPFRIGLPEIYSKNLAFNILENAIWESNGSAYTPEVIYEKQSDFTYEQTKEINIPSTTNYKYLTYASDYTIDNGKITLINPQLLDYSKDYELLKGKYIVSLYPSNVKKDSTYINTIYKVSPTDVYENSFNYSTVKVKMSNEGVLATTEDDHGLTYYYRGNVKDNYVNFAGMCWRIVRIVGNGSIKLILQDKNETCSQEMDGRWFIPTVTGGTKTSGIYGISKYDAGTLTASDGTTNESSVSFVDYLHGNVNSEESMATAFKNFQNDVLSEYLDKLKIGDWCLADTAYTRDATTNPYTYNILSSSEKLDSIILNNDNIYYDSYVRLNISLEEEGSLEPTLKCNGTIMNDWDDNEKTPMYVGTITADEALYAGANELENYNNYLYSIYSDYFWTLSPSDRMNIYRLSPAIRLGVHEASTSGISFRPSVILASNTTITSGNGTITNPYIIG